MNIGDRIKMIAKYYGVRPSAFEKQCGFSNGYIKGVKWSIGDDKLKKILEHYPNINKVWLLTGEGEMLLSFEVVEENRADLQHRIDLLTTENQFLKEKIEHLETYRDRMEIDYQKTVAKLQGKLHKLENKSPSPKARGEHQASKPARPK